MNHVFRFFTALILLLTSAGSGQATQCASSAEHDYAADLAFLQKHSDVIELKRSDSDARLCVVPAWQGRVMTSATSEKGTSYGWLNYDLIKAGLKPKAERTGLESHIYVFGGEERFWIGPEGGQFASYFAPGTPFDFDHWFVPSFIDTDPWKLVSHSEGRARFRHEVEVLNWSGNTWNMAVDREVVLLSATELAWALGQEVPASVKAVAHETINQVSNAGDQAWDETTGMPSIWILGMMKHGPKTTVAIPFATEGTDLGKVVTDDYFGKVPADRLTYNEKTGVLYFMADGNHRSKIGISPQRSLGVAGSWDALNKVLTIVQYNQPRKDVRQYVNSLWKKQDSPFSGDAINSYNDGPIGDDQLGPFYEIETSSPALKLAPGSHYRHVHRTIHLEGTPEDLDGIARKVLGASLADIEAALK